MQRPPRRLAGVIQTGGGPAGRAGRHLEPGHDPSPHSHVAEGSTAVLVALRRRWDDDRHNETCARCCSWWWCSTGDVQVFRIATILRTARATDQADRPTRCGSEACHCCERRTILDPPTSWRRVRERCAQQRTETSAVDLETDQPGADARTTRSSPMDTVRSDWPSQNPRADSKGGS